MSLENPVFCALDTTDLGRAETLARSLTGSVGGVKIGMEFFNAHGPAGYRAVAATDLPIFLDLKLHDIPNTVAGGIRAVLPLRPAIVNVHTAGGGAMMRAAADAAKEAGESRPLVIGVTMLTSLDASDLRDTGVSDSPSDHVRRLAGLAASSGLDGVVCSAHEIEVLRRDLDKDFKLIVPGIRPAGSDVGDQKRIMTPVEALTLGADLLVIGRPITSANDPRAAAEEIGRSLAA
ncbi:orotidine-5'-phosphate decarboxylase [Parvibaculum sp.]|uniref:orotidine-5'-phosphate decarboxylase n=1 Tax=Parvibaculum sp. TaxID=2024848 RepID=UPI000C4A326E|nr:orotidine-5'-phosphate decarboxylase [Parvibaculum sp.]MAM94439.1 orotidine-5'-phosphate decarboxylase [Parvibaculum sp.]|tara:strand:+ start:4267 stop:4968 length:702 start_codon:yes stop_codon:yes gene_type:complete